ncbi:unnamed protein product [Ilex paraguariensis]|uniref:NAC domain-containing protein n=1 Tax=Ilex paraguariensis TaxID=185542 RepID=A0ABC8S4C9_9AQUA
MAASLVGLRFHPTDQELTYILGYMISHNPSLYERFVTIDDLYGDMESWEIFGNSEEKCRYFFTELKKKTAKGKRFARTVGKGKGSWKGQDKGKPIQNREGKVIGYKRSLRYENLGSTQHGRWLMKEYSISSPQDYVLCRIKRLDHTPTVAPVCQNQQNEDEHINSSRQKRPRLDGCEHIENLITGLVPIYGEVADTLDSNLCFDPEDLMFEIDNVAGFPEDLMLHNLESATIPLGTSPLPISLEAESSIYNQYRHILLGNGCCGMEDWRSSLPEDPVIDLGNVCCGMDDWRSGLPEDPVIDIAESRTMSSGPESTIYHHTQFLGGTAGTNMEERIPGLPENLMNMDNVAHRTMPLGTLPSGSKSDKETQIFQSILCSNMEESSIYDKGIHILQSDLCFDMEEWRRGLPEDLMSDNLESRNIALGTLPLTLNLGVES